MLLNRAFGNDKVDLIYVLTILERELEKLKKGIFEGSHFDIRRVIFS